MVLAKSITDYNKVFDLDAKLVDAYVSHENV
jgi:hypothetical protein